MMPNPYHKDLYGSSPEMTASLYVESFVSPYVLERTT